MKRSMIIAAALALLAVVVVYVATRPANDSSRLPVTTALKREVPQLGFERIVPEAKFEGLSMMGKPNKSSVGDIDGVILRVLRYQPISEAVEYRYCLPKGFILSILAQESQGAVWINGTDDGGAGHSHMQPSTARAFGLRVYGNATALVDHAHGRALRALIKEKHENMQDLIEYDDRFHPILNLDAVGRMLSIAMEQGPPMHSKKYTGTDPMQAAIFAYSGRPEYWKRVIFFRDLLYSPSNIDRIRKRFNERNPHFTIDGKPGDFDKYLAVAWKSWDNFGLAKYKQLPLYIPAGIRGVNAMYGAPPKL